MLASEDGPRYTDEMVQRELALMARIEQEAQEGGILTSERCSAFQPEPAEDTPRQWAHLDHMVKAMSNFRRLLLMEQQRHRAAAKKLAEACRDAWLARQPKTAEQLEAEARAMWIGKYRLVMRAMFGTWENVKAEINKRRLQEWEEEEQRRVKAALQEAVNISEQKLQARRALHDSDGSSVEDSDDDMGSDDNTDGGDDTDVNSVQSIESGSADDESNMTSSDDDEDAKSLLSDEGLTQDQLREKYAHLPQVENLDDAEIQPFDENEQTGADGEDDTSDESIDMDDDLGSSEMDSNDDESGSDGDAEESEEDDNDASGLLGLFFGKSELKKMKEEPAETSEAIPADGEVTEVNNVDSAAPEVAGQSKTKAAGSEQTKRLNEDYGTSTRGITVNGIEPKHSENEDMSVKPPVVNGIHGSTSDQSPPVHEDDEMEGVIDDKAAAKEDRRLISPAPAQTTANSQKDSQCIQDATPVPEVTVIEPQPDVKQTSPETDAVTNGVSPEPSQSPRTSDTRPSDIETPSQTDHLAVQKDDSRSTSPQPASPKTEIPFLLRGTLREYQHYGLDWLAGLYANNTNGILADEMGLGKTIQTIALLAHLACHHEVWGPHLVIVPTSVMLNWEMEFKKWCPGFKILTYYGTQDERKRKRQGWSNNDVWNVCITSYQMVLQDQQVFKRRRWHYMILDEAHNIKNFKSQRWQTLLGFNTHSRLLLTGTPLQNNLTELWSLLFFLMPPENGEGGFADLKEFHDWFHKPESQILESGREQMDDEARAIISKLHKVLRPYLLRRLKADVEKQMPAKYEHVEFCRLSKRQRELYDGFLARSETRATLSGGNYLSIINCLMQLRKVCNHPDLFVDRPIMTSFRMRKSVPSDYLTTEKLVRQRLLTAKPMSVVSLSFLNLVPTQHEGLSGTTAARIYQLGTNRVLMDLKETQRARVPQPYPAVDTSTVRSNIAYLENAGRWARFEELQHCLYLNTLRRQQRPVYGKRLIDFVTLNTDERPFKPRPKVPRKILQWCEDNSNLVRSMIQTLDQRSDLMNMIITKFACVTPAVVTRDMNEIVLGLRGAKAFSDEDLRLSAPIKTLPFMQKQRPLDPWHEARMRLSVQFPDKRLLQYDCGKLQALDRLLRKLHAGGHRALIFTQMTKVLDILEQFLNIHGHKYLRLDGATKVEQRQILTDRFNHDNRILCFILSTRSGGLGINLTGADTVIFYDQDWNPAMDKQCQDRCHRIGQTRDVHIYRLVSEHTIEANILRKASQKQMLDDVVIQEGEFTTDYFNKLSVRDVIGADAEAGLFDEGDAAANAAMDRVLGGVETGDQRTAGRALEQAEDKEDVAAARLAEKEIQEDDADFSEKPMPTPTPGSGSGVSSVRQGTPRGETASTPLGRSSLGLFAEQADIVAEEEVETEVNAWGEKVRTVDEYMLAVMAAQLKGTPLDLPKDKKKPKKKGKDLRKR
jgi:helicase SWR1